MTSPSSDLTTDLTTSLAIGENQTFSINNFQVEVLSYLGQLSADIHYFKVNISSIDTETDASSNKLALLRVGSSEGGLQRELELRKVLGNYRMVAELITHTVKDSVIINSAPVLNTEILEEKQDELETNTDSVNVIDDENESIETESLIETSEEILSSNQLEPESLPEVFEAILDNNQLEAESLPETSEEILSSNQLEESDDLEEVYYPEIEVTSSDSTSQIIVISDFPEETKTLENCIKNEHKLEDFLSVTSQFCQFLKYVYERNWCLISIQPQLIQIGTPSQFFDLTNAYPIGEILPSGLQGNYCAPELASNKNPIHESMSSYTVGALLYHYIHKQPVSPQAVDIKISPIPRIYQILKICLSPVPEERFPLAQLLSILVETRQLISIPKIHWKVASNSTLGLSTKRLQNEDNYGVRQQQLSNLETTIMGVVADGMGGMSQGEVASKLAVQTVLHEPIAADLKNLENRNKWLISLVQKANNVISENVKDGGTTFSLVFAIAQQLMVAHVGDSRIYLLRQGEITQLSEDHSLVAMLVANGQITEEESLEHPDRNVLTKSLGSKRRLSDGYVQDLRRTTQGLSLKLENEDTLLLCSDGVWDLVNKNEFVEIFNENQDLQLAVDQIIKRVLQRGASDNATLLALQFCIDKSQ